MTHVVFDGGKPATLEFAAKKSLHVVTPAWVHACEQAKSHVSEADHQYKPLSAELRKRADSAQVMCAETQFQFANSDDEIPDTPKRNAPATPKQQTVLRKVREVTIDASMSFQRPADLCARHPEQRRQRQGRWNSP